MLSLTASLQAMDGKNRGALQTLPTHPVSIRRLESDVKPSFLPVSFAVRGAFLLRPGPLSR